MNPTLRAELLKKVAELDWPLSPTEAVDFALPYAKQVAELQGKLDEAKAEFELCRNAYKTKNAQYHELQRLLAQLQAERNALAEKLPSLTRKEAEDKVFAIWKAGMDAEEVGMPSFDMAKDSPFIKDVIDKLTTPTRPGG
jgi:Tfp pilus assembly protein PilO